MQGSLLIAVKALVNEATIASAGQMGWHVPEVKLFHCKRYARHSRMREITHALKGDGCHPYDKIFGLPMQQGLEIRQ